MLRLQDANDQGRRGTNVKLLFQLEVSDRIVDECRNLLRNNAELPEARLEPAGPQAAVEWSLPAVLVIILGAASASFLDGFFEQLGLKDVGRQTGRQVAERLTRVLELLVSVERRWFASPGKIDAASPRSPLLKIPHIIEYKINEEHSIHLKATFIFMEIVGVSEMEAALQAAHERVGISNLLLEEARRDASRSLIVPRLYIGSNQPEIALRIALSRAQRVSEALSGSFVFDVQERRWLKVH